MSSSLSSSLSSSISTGALSAHPFLNMGASPSRLQQQQQPQHPPPQQTPPPPDPQYTPGLGFHGDLGDITHHHQESLSSPLKTPTQASVSASHRGFQHQQQQQPQQIPVPSSSRQLHAPQPPAKLRRQFSDVRRPAKPVRTSSNESTVSNAKQPYTTPHPPHPSSHPAQTNPAESTAAPVASGLPSSRGIKFPENLPVPLPRKTLMKSSGAGAHSRSLSVPDLENAAAAEQQPRRFGIVRKLSLKRFSDRSPAATGSGPFPPPSGNNSTSNTNVGNVAATVIPRSLSRKGSLSRLGSSRGAQKRSAAAETPSTSSAQHSQPILVHPTADGASTAPPSRLPKRSASHFANLGKGVGVPSPVMESTESMEAPSTPPTLSLSPESAARRARATRDASVSPRKSSFRGVRAAASPYSRQAHRPTAPSSNVSSSSKSSTSPAQRAAREWRAKLVNLSVASPEHTDDEVAAAGFGGPRPPPRPKTAAAGSNPSTPLSEVPPYKSRHHRRRSLDSLVSVSTKSGRHVNVSPACSAFGGEAYDEQQRLSIWSADFDPERLSLHAASVSSSTVSRVSRGTSKSMKSNKSRASTNLTMVPEVPKIPDHMRSQLSSISGVEPLVPTSAVGQGSKNDTASSQVRSSRGHNRSATEGQSSVVAASMTTASTSDSFSTPQWEPSERYIAVRSSAPNMSPVLDDEDEVEPKRLRGLGLKMDLSSLKSKPLPPPPTTPKATTPPPSLSPDDGAQLIESPHPAMSTRRTSTPDHTEYLVTPTCATVDERLMARAGPVVVSDSEGEYVPPVRKEIGQRPMGPRKNYFNGHIRDASDVKMAIALAQSQSQTAKLSRSHSSDSKMKVHMGGPREPTKPSSASVSRSTSQTLVNAPPPTNATMSRSNSKSASLDQGSELLNSFDLTPGLEDGGRRPRKKGMPMQDLRKWLETSR